MLAPLTTLVSSGAFGGKNGYRETPILIILAFFSFFRLKSHRPSDQRITAILPHVESTNL